MHYFTFGKPLQTGPCLCKFYVCPCPKVIPCPLQLFHKKTLWLWERVVSVAIKDLLSNVVNYIFGDPIPVPEVLHDDPETSWHLWEQSVRELDEIIVEAKRATIPAELGEELAER